MKIRSVVLLLFVCSFPLPALAADHLQGVSELILTGHASEARTRLEAAAAAYKAEGDARHEGISLMLLGFANVELRDDAAARSNLEEAAEKLGSTSDYFTAWMALHYAAAFEMREAKWARAVERHQAALAMLRQGAQAGTFSLEAAMLLGPMFGFDVGPLATLASSIPEMLKPVFLQLGEMMSRDALGSVYTELGELDRAGTELMRAQQLSSGLMGAYDTSIAEHVGDLRRRQWRLDEARDTYRKALDGVPLLPAFLLRDQLLELRILDRLAEIEMLRGDIDAALGWNDRAQKLIRPLKNPARDASILEDRAFLLMQASRFTDATQLLRQAQTLAEKSGDVKMQARILTSIGSLEFFRGEYGTAPSTMERAIELYQKVKDPTGESHAWLMLSQLYLTIGASDSATISIGKARALAAKSPFAPSRAIVELVAASATLGENGPSPDFMQKLDRFLHDPELGGLFPTEAMLTMFDRAIAIGTGREPVRGRETPGAGTLPMLSEMATLLQARDLILRGEGKTARELLTAKLGTAPGNETRFGYLALIAGSWVREG
ncbi:MAG TPA: hypothetical protein VF698_17930, partial [Thermoanaerobaculia bacterium]